MSDDDNIIPIKSVSIKTSKSFCDMLDDLEEDVPPRDVPLKATSRSSCSRCGCTEFAVYEPLRDDKFKPTIACSRCNTVLEE